MEEEIQLGLKVRDKIGSTFKELEMLRKATWSNAVLLDKSRSGLLSTYKRKFNDFDVKKAEYIQKELIAYNTKVENLLGHVPAELDPKYNPELLEEEQEAEEPSE